MKKDNWILTTEQLPELTCMRCSSEYVLCWEKDGPTVGKYANFHLIGLRWVDLNDDEIHPTHWKPIEPPIHSS